MAETIGRAYIKILADGSGMGESIRRELDRADIDGVAEEGGRDFSKNYAKGYEDEERKSKNFSKSLKRTIDKGFRDMEQEAGRMGSRTGSVTADRMVFRIRDRLQKSFPELQHVAGDLGQRMGEAMHDDFVKHGKFTKGFDDQLQAAMAAMARDADEWEKNWRRDLDKITADIGRTTKAIGVDMDRMAVQIDNANDTITKSNRDMHTHWVRDLEAIDKTMVASGKKRKGLIDGWLRDFDRLRKDDDETHRHFSRLITGFDDFGDAVGRAFGKGNRNNFINFFGSLVGNLAALPGALFRGINKIGEFGSSIRDTFVEAGRGFSGFIAVVGEIGPKIGLLIAAIPAALIGLGALTSALLLTAGAAAALVSTIGFGLVGAVAPLVGLLGPLGLVAGGVAASFIGMSDAAKKTVKEAFAPLKADFKALGDAARPGILDGLTEGAKNLEEPMSRLEPLFKVVGDSIGEFMKVSSKIAFGPEFTAFVNTMSKELPGQMRSLGTIVGNVLDGLFGLFATLQPVTDTFLDSLERITGAFASWSVSPQATNFFTGAAESAGKLLDFLGAVWDLLSTILSAGKSAGDSLFGSMTKNIQDWTDALKANPDILDNFFKDAKKMGQAIGDVVESIGHLIDALDTPVTRDWAIGIIKGASDLINVIADLLGLLGELPGSFQAIIIGAGLGLAAFTKLSGGVVSLIGKLRDVETRAGTMSSGLRVAAGAAGIAGLAASMYEASQQGINFGNVLSGAVSGAITGLAVSGGNPLGALIGGVAGGGLTALVGAFSGAKSEAEKFRESLAKPLVAKIDTTAVQNLVDLLAKAHGNYRQIAADSAEQALEQAAGGVDKLNAALAVTGLRKDTVAQALSGDPAAMKATNDAMAALNDNIAQGTTLLDDFSAGSAVWGTSTTEVDDLTAALDAGLIGQKQYTDAVNLWNDAMSDGILSGKEFNAVSESNAAIMDQVTTNLGKQKDVLQTLTNITGDAASAQSILNQHNKEGAAFLGATIDQLHKMPKKVQTDIGLNGAPETSRQAFHLLQEFGKFLKFKDIKTVISAPGVDLTRGQIKRLAEQARLTPKQIKILLKAENANKAGKDIEGVKKKADDATKKDHKVKMGADTSDFDTQLSHIKAKMSNIPKTKAEAKFSADTSKFNSKNDEVKRALNKANTTTVTPKINVDNSAAMAGINNTHTALNNIPRDVYSTIHVNTVRTGGKAASGGLFSGAQLLTVGEAGPEAVVPLSRPLSQVDPAVRELSAIAQGMSFATRQQRPVAQRVVDVGGIQIITPTKDPGAVAQEMVNRLVAVGY